MVSLPGHEPDAALERLASQISPGSLEAPARLDEARRELDLYFEGRLREFDLPLDWQLTHGFRRKVLRATARIPYGETRSYTEMARSAGNERAVSARRARPAAPTRSRSSSPATASCAPAAPWAATAAGWR